MSVLDIHRSWLKSGRYYRGLEGVLPQNDPDRAGRAAKLARTRARFEYNHTHLPPIPLLESVPDNEQFAKRYIIGRAERTAALLPDVVAWRLHTLHDPFDRLDDFGKLFNELPVPASLANWERDDYFAHQRLAGANPLKLRRVGSAGELPLAATALPGGQSAVDDDIAAGRLFVADYRDLAFVAGGATPGGTRKHLPTPVATFRSEDGVLLPHAIEVEPGEGVVTPASEPTAWRAAKIATQIADANHHEMSSHLSRCHFVMEPFGVSTHRQLSTSHPLNILLRPHLRFLLVNNELGRQFLINEGGIVDHLLAGTIEESLRIVTDAFESWDVREFSFPAELRNRGLDDVRGISDHPFRDDGRLLWEAIEAFVDDYLGIYYAQPADVAGDPELQAWAAEIADPAVGRIRGMPARFETREQLASILSTVLFTCGPLHSAVNYAQYEFMAFTPNMPLAAYEPVPPGGAALTEADLMGLLPSATRTKQQLEIMDQLTCYHFDRLGDYHRDAFADAPARAAVKRFQERLRRAGEVIAERNARRRYPYIHLLPANVLNSISI